MDDRNCALVGLGSYLVNMGGCNDCHTGGGPPNFNFAAGGDPYFGQPKKTDPTTYLSGGLDFGPVGAPPSPNIISRNLTPSTKTGLPEGDHTFEQFLTILRTGKDFDHLHPNCSASLTCLSHNGNGLLVPPNNYSGARGDEVVQHVPEEQFSEINAVP